MLVGSNECQRRSVQFNQGIIEDADNLERRARMLGLAARRMSLIGGTLVEYQQSKPEAK
jgi:hypothetical protein